MNYTKISLIFFSLHFLHFYISIQIYNQQLNKNGTLQMFLLAHYEATLYFSRTEFTFPLITCTSYVQVNSIRLK